MPLLQGCLVADRFAIDRVAGSGGMGVVYRAFDRVTEQPVALKILRREPAESPSTQRFIREAELLAQLVHPNIVSYVAHGETPDGLRYLAMEWLDGADLAQRLAAGGLTLLDSMTCVRAVAAALAVTHGRGIVHRDRTHKHKICLHNGYSAVHRRRTDYASLPFTHSPSQPHVA